MNPLAYLLPALHAALAGLTVDGVPVFVGQFVDGNTAGHYVLIDQPTDADAGGSVGCEHFSCTVLLDVVTQFPTDQVNSLAAESLVSQINARLRRQRLALGGQWDCGPGSLEPAVQQRETDGGLTLHRRLLRYRWEVYYHEAATAVETD